jgi:2-keto-4-pentenoate hydratase/2-oxohepta-3-ene-1,7-dioic acid hydratase in catechol pathway
VSYISSFYSFRDGDLIMAGAPRGVASINMGDRLSGKISEKEKLIIEGSWVVK